MKEIVFYRHDDRDVYFEHAMGTMQVYEQKPPGHKLKEKQKIFYLHVSHPALFESVGPVDSSQPMLLPSIKW